MLTIYHSNQLDLLKSLTAQLIKRQPLNAVFEKEVILVQSQGMGQWLQIQLAQELGIAANIHYPFPTQFVWDIYRIFYPELPQKNAFDADFMLWVLLAILPDLAKTPSFSALQRYFEQENQQKYYQLASCLADLFDQYLVYRPDWIKAWEAGELVAELSQDEQQWQAILWREMIAYSQRLSSKPLHRADIHHTVIAALKQKKLTRTQKKSLPKRIFIFGIVSLPPLYLALFNALSLHLDVHIMFMNPCRQYWGDIVDRSFVNKYIDDEHVANMMLQQSHPLLASWGKLGREHLVLLQDFQKQDIDAFFDYDERTLLASVQQSILDLHSEPELAANSYLLSSSEHKQEILRNDDSLTIHACHSEQREVEVLYDYLLATLDRHQSIDLNDCVVMVADIEHYAPYIQAVFDNAPKNRYLPYTISDQTFRYIEPIVQGFFLLLELPKSRLEIEYIFDLLEIPPIARHFNLNAENLVQLRHWIVDAGIRFGLDSNTDEPHSWLVGIQRMLLGYIMESQLDSWQDIFPYDGTTGLDAELVGFLADFIAAIAKWHRLLSEPHSITQWQSLCAPLLDEFFLFDSDSEALLMMIEEQWQNIIEQALAANYCDELSITVLRELLQSKFQHNAISHRFLIGKINFCTMMPMRSVPFKVVCLLGMNDGVYPRGISPLGFDLIYHHSRIGDRSRRNDDRYLFLEALLSAQQQLYISYIGYDIQTNELRYPSILVDELIEYLKQCYVLNGDQHLDGESSAAGLVNHLIHVHTRMPFSRQNYLPGDTKIVSYADEWLAAAKDAGQFSNFITPLSQELIEDINLDKLKQFYLHPIRELAKYRFGYVINYIDEQLPSTENFNLNNLERYHLNNQILDVLLSNNLTGEQLADKLYQKMLHSNQLPYGAFGQILYREQQKLIEPLISRINKEKQESCSSLDVDIMVDDLRIIGRIQRIQCDGILQWRSTKLTVKDGIVLWIEHLVMCILQPDSHLLRNRIYGREETTWCFRTLLSQQAQVLLSQLLGAYLTGLNQPMFMPLQSTWRWLETAYDATTQHISKDSAVLLKAKTQFITQWQGHLAIRGECDDYYIRLYPELTDELINEAIQNAMIYLLPLMVYREIDDAD
ncbi:DNA helicase/exodeoxyribonuclease V gamma subunit [Orbus hercynius]|uniref:RecBCD enzyme subunit RecC n=1 Tax=Orbus hercynius TaxID=593135 RepID=A0A495RHB9_9GAMM|nr:exodeoxyribonuclease V subunit gamma [Orbus hercynius]RKS86821.1 DNA helicase/exodeoxyribonuclease V gamma subunit [Orbus hercynius]